MSEMPPPSAPMDYAPPPSSSALVQLKVAAITTIVFASLAWIYSLLEGGFRAYILLSGQPMPPMNSGISPEATKVLLIFGLALELLTVLLAPVVVVGAVQMLRRRSFGFVRVSAVLAMLPISTFCCCFLTLPLAIWSLILLSRPDVQDAFRTNTPAPPSASPFP
jgi:hypothetical protein